MRQQSKQLNQEHAPWPGHSIYIITRRPQTHGPNALRQQTPFKKHSFHHSSSFQTVRHACMVGSFPWMVVLRYVRRRVVLCLVEKPLHHRHVSTCDSDCNTACLKKMDALGHSPALLLAHVSLSYIT